MGKVEKSLNRDLAAHVLTPLGKYCICGWLLTHLSVYEVFAYFSNAAISRKKPAKCWPAMPRIEEVSQFCAVQAREEKRGKGRPWRSVVLKPKRDEESRKE